MTVRPITVAGGAHLRVVALLAEYQELTDAQLVRRYQARAYRAADPWPLMAESTLRTRRDELREWGEVVELSRDGRSASKRPMRVWGLNPAPRAFADFNGERVTASPGFGVVLEQLRATTEDLLIVESLRAFAGRVGAAA